jgi:16S rRNA (guanine966-N2)-methyltransferase
MRIIAGEWRGRALGAPPGRGTRPTADRTREGLFSMLQSRVGSFEGLQVADLFAGTGALGLEALSRGAAHCLFVENDRGALDMLRQNIGRFSAEGRTEMRSQSVEHMSPPARPCDIVFMDPPYTAGLANMALERIANPGWVAPSGWISLETDGERPPLPDGFSLEAERRFGKAHLFLFRHRSG